MDRLAHERLLIEQGEQLTKLARAVFETDHAAHVAVVDPEAGQQVHRAVALVFELTSRWSRPRGWPTRHWYLVWGRRLPNANARLLIHTEQWPVRRWAEQQLNNRNSFGGE